MSNLVILLLTWAAGVGIGALFFGGLWWTVRAALTHPQPALVFFASLVLRMAVTLIGFYFVAGGHWQRMLACLLGFAMARPLVMRLTRPSPGLEPAAPSGAGHAP